MKNIKEFIINESKKESKYGYSLELELTYEVEKWIDKNHKDLLHQPTYIKNDLVRFDELSKDELLEIINL